MNDQFTFMRNIWRFLLSGTNYENLNGWRNFCVLAGDDKEIPYKAQTFVVPKDLLNVTKPFHLAFSAEIP